MAKRLILLVTAIAMAVTMFLPVSAETPDSLKDSVVTSVDYRTESPADLTGNLNFTKTPEDVTYVEYEGVTCVDRTSLTAEGTNEGFRMQYQDGNYQTLNEVFTVEAYVYMTEDVYGMPLEIWWGGDNSFACLGWNGYRFAFGQNDFDPAKSVMEEEDRELTNGWYHLAVTSDGTTMKLYVNGELVGSGTGPEDGMAGLWYYYNMKTDTLGYAMAYMAIYNVAATEEQVKEMYAPKVDEPEEPDVGLADSAVTSVDYRTESPADLTGNLDFTKSPEDVTYVEYEGVTCVDRTSLTAEGTNEGFRMQYQNDNYQTLNEVFTLETYVYMTEDLYGLPVEIWWGGDEPTFAALAWNGYRFGFGHSDLDPASSVMEEEDRELTNGWYHIVVTSDATTMNLYVNGELVGSGANPTGGMSGLWYYYNMKTDTLGYAMAYLTIYNVTATEEQVTALYEAVNTSEPEEPEDPEIPTGTDYTVAADSVSAFKAGDKVTVKLNINDINENGLVGLDLFLSYDEALLAFDQEATLALWDEADHPLGSSGWWMTAVTDVQDNTPIVDIRMANDDANGVTEDGVLYAELIFTALADSAAEGGPIASVIWAEGALNDAAISMAYGTGTTVYTKAPAKELTLLPDETKLVLSDEYLRGVKAEQTPESIIARFENSENVVILNPDGTEMADGQYVGTGCLVCLMDGEEVVDSVEVVIRGDTDGNGMITTADYMRVRNLFKQTIELEGAQFLAADTDGSGDIATPDYMQIRNHFAQKYDLFLGL